MLVDNPRRFEPVAKTPGEASVATDKELSDFLKSVEKRAFKRTVYAVRDDEAALDILQDSMIRLAELVKSPGPSLSNVVCTTKYR